MFSSFESSRFHPSNINDSSMKQRLIVDEEKTNFSTSMNENEALKERYFWVIFLMIQLTEKLVQKIDSTATSDSSR